MEQPIYSEQQNRKGLDTITAIMFHLALPDTCYCHYFIILVQEESKGILDHSKPEAGNFEAQLETPSKKRSMYLQLTTCDTVVVFL